MPKTLEWRQVSRNHWVSDLAFGATVEVYRRQEWKRLKTDLGVRPWGIVLFGHEYFYDDALRFDEVYNAMSRAETMAFNLIRTMFEKWGVE